jgi:hypothetical protein
VPSNSVNASDLYVPGVERSTDDIESLRLTQDGALIRGPILACPANEAVPEAGVKGVINAVKSGSQAEVLEVLGERVAVGEEGGEA